MILLVISSIQLARPNSFLLCIFLQTLIFVTFNKVSLNFRSYIILLSYFLNLLLLSKVCTAQYFTWYISLAPLILHQLHMSLHCGLGLAVLWITSLSLWLWRAYLFEFSGVNTFFSIWVCSLIFHAVNVAIICCCISSASSSSAIRFIEDKSS